jgi:hypothetical protein
VCEREREKEISARVDRGSIEVFSENREEEDRERGERGDISNAYNAPFSL